MDDETRQEIDRALAAYFAAVRAAFDKAIRDLELACGGPLPPELRRVLAQPIEIQADRAN